MGHSDQRDDPSRPPPGPSRETPRGAPSFDLLEDFEADTVESPDRSDAGSHPLDPTLFDPDAQTGDPPTLDPTIRIDVEQPSEQRLPPPLPVTRTGDRPPSNDSLADAADDFDIEVELPPAALPSRPEASPIIGLPLPAPLPVGVSTRDIPPTSQRAPTPASEPVVNLPCSILVVDEDRRAGAQIAARLMEVGYTCRVSAMAGVQAVLAQQSFDVALVDVPREDMLRDFGAQRIALMAPWSGPIVLTGSAEMPAEDLPPQVRAALSKPLLPGELIRTLEAARARPGAAGGLDPAFAGAESSLSDRRSAAPVGAKDQPTGINDESPSEHLHPIAGGIRLVMTRADGRGVRCTVREASYGGRLVVESTDPAPSGTEFDVEVILMDGRRSEIPAVAAGGDRGFELYLDLDPGDVVHYGRFLDEVRDPALPAAEALRARERVVVISSPPTGDLDAVWQSACEKLDDDAVQQAFIQACLREQQMDFAIRSYRSLKEAYPDDPRVAKYLNQVGTIVGFYALRKNVASEDVPMMSTGLKVALGLFVAAAFLLVAIVLFLR